MADTSERDALPVVELTAWGSPSATARLQIMVEGQPIRLAITVPAEPVTLSRILPILQGFTNAVIGVAESKVANHGESISCRSGCGACCRQIVPISPSEAHSLKRLVDSLPEPKRQAVQERFTAAVRQLRESNLADSMDAVREVGDEGELAAAYFQLGIACPFLEEESCSIHQDRPLACREYLVTSPPQECSRPNENNVRCVPVPARTSWALRAVEWDAQPMGFGWLPLVLSLQWAESHSEPQPLPGPEWIQRYFNRIARTAQRQV